MEDLFSPEQLTELRTYRDVRYFWAAVLIPLNFLISGGIAWFSARIYSACERFTARLRPTLRPVAQLPVLRVLPKAFHRLWGGADWVSAVIFVVVALWISILAYLPLDLYIDHLHERRFGMSNESLLAFARHWWVKKLVYSLAMVFAAMGLLGLARRTQRWWWLLGGVCAIALVGAAALDPYRSRLHVGQEPLPPGELREALTNLLEKAQVEFDDLFVETTSARSDRVQAYFAGQGQTRRIVLSDTMLKAFTSDEVVAVVAHEAGHVRESRLPSFVASATALLVFLLFIHRLFLRSVRRGWFGGVVYGDVRLFPLITFSFLLLSSLAAPISSAFSRQREYEADRFAVRLLGDDTAFRSMLIKAAQINRMDPDPPKWLVLRSFTHPPIRDRFEALDALGRSTPNQDAQ